MFYFIYKTTNLINDKIYIGKHITNNLSDKYLGSGLVLSKAIKRHGKSNFIQEIIEFCDKTILDEREKFWIKEFNSLDPDIGYNISYGGTGGIHTPNHYFLSKSVKHDNFKGHKHSEESKIKIKETILNTFKDPSIRAKCSLKKERNGFYGKNHSDESKEKMRKPKSDEHKRKISETLKNKNRYAKSL